MRARRRWVRRPHRGVLPGPLKLQRGYLAAEAVHEGDHLPRPVLPRVPRATADLAIVLAQAARRVDGGADVRTSAWGEALEQVAAPQPGLFWKLRATGRRLGARRRTPRARYDWAPARHATLSGQAPAAAVARFYVWGVGGVCGPATHRPPPTSHQPLIHPLIHPSPAPHNPLTNPLPLPTGAVHRYMTARV